MSGWFSQLFVEFSQYLSRVVKVLNLLKVFRSQHQPQLQAVIQQSVLKGNKAQREQYIMNDSKKKILLDIVIDVKYLKGKREKRGCENLGFVVFGVKWSPRKVSTVYRRRFAIESSYRMRNVVKPKTSSKNANIRYFYALISFLLKNIWLYLQKKHFTIVKRGPQVIDEDKFRFDMFVLLIKEWLRRKLKVRLIVECLR